MQAARHGRRPRRRARSKAETTQRRATLRQVVAPAMPPPVGSGSRSPAELARGSEGDGRLRHGEGSEEHGVDDMPLRCCALQCGRAVLHRR